MMCIDQTSCYGCRHTVAYLLRRTQGLSGIIFKVFVCSSPVKRLFFFLFYSLMFDLDVCAESDTRRLFAHVFTSEIDIRARERYVSKERKVHNV